MKVIRRFFSDGDLILTFKKGIFVGGNCPKILDFSIFDELKFCFDSKNDKMYLYCKTDIGLDVNKLDIESELILKYGQKMIEIDDEDFDELVIFMDMMYIKSHDDVKDTLTSSPVNPALVEFIKRQMRNVKLRSLIN